MPDEHVRQEDAKGTHCPDVLENGLLWLRTLWNTRTRQYLIQPDASSKARSPKDFPSANGKHVA